MLRQLYKTSTATANPSQYTGLLPGGAGVQTSGKTPNWGISAPILEAESMEVLDYTAPTLITPGVTPGSPARAGKLVVLDPVNGAFAAIWKQNTVIQQAIPAGQYGVVTAAGQVSEAGTAVGSSNGNISQGSKALIVKQGPVQAYVQGTVGNVAISAGMPLASDGAGNLTYAGASPSAGTVLATFADALIANTISVPVLANVVIGGY